MKSSCHFFFNHLGLPTLQNSTQFSNSTYLQSPYCTVLICTQLCTNLHCELPASEFTSLVTTLHGPNAQKTHFRYCWVRLLGLRDRHPASSLARWLLPSNGPVLLSRDVFTSGYLAIRHYIYICHVVQTESGVHQASCPMGTGGKAAGRWSWPLSSN
jgi:hypothetical protein